jgi:hypothetical protein
MNLLVIKDPACLVLEFQIAGYMTVRVVDRHGTSYPSLELLSQSTIAVSIVEEVRPKVVATTYVKRIITSQ